MNIDIQIVCITLILNFVLNLCKPNQVILDRFLKNKGNNSDPLSMPVLNC